MTELTQDNYTKEEVQALLQTQETSIDDLTAKISDFEKQVKSIPELTKQNLTNSIKVEMLKSGLNEDMFDLVADSSDIETATKKITKLVELNKKNKIDNSYKPDEHKQSDDEYSVAEKKGNVEGMLKSKLSKLFQ